jgi:hypothetical protein
MAQNFLVATLPFLAIILVSAAAERIGKVES